MSALYPFSMQPAFDPRPWGTLDLSPIYPNHKFAEKFEHAIHDKRAEELLNWINVYPGEMIYVAGGTVHTLGPGAIIVETQQQSDTTYRLYDYGRPRELHLKEGLAAIKEKAGSGKVIRPAPSNLNGPANRRAPLISS